MENNQLPTYYGLSDEMFQETKVDFHSFKNGESRFRILPGYAPGKTFHKIGLHWGFTDSGGGRKAIVCTLESHDNCPICNEVNGRKERKKQIRARVEELEAMKATASSEQQQAIMAELGQLAQEVAELDAYISEFRRKPTFLWNILTEEGTQKVLKLTYNGHEPLHSKVKWYWQNKRIDVTDPRNNMLMWVSRTGQKAQTRYSYEVLENFAKPIQFGDLTDLSKIYRIRPPEDLQKILSQGFVDSKEDPTEQQYTVAGSGNVNGTTPPAGQAAPAPAAAAPNYTQPQPNQSYQAPPAQPAPNPAPQPAQNPGPVEQGSTSTLAPAPNPQGQYSQPQPQAAAPASNPAPQPTPTPQAQAPKPQIETTPEQDQQIADMMAALQE